MTTQPFGRLVRRLSQSLNAADLIDASDADLLARVRGTRDPAALETIVNRHGPRVLAACRKVLSTEADVDDAFQATFLVLLRDPRAVRRGPSLGAWLYGVAHRVALHSRRLEARRRRHEQQYTPTQLIDLSWREASAALHEELNRLPDATRLPLVLCYLEGLSRDEAAAQLGRTLNSVKKSLERGRELLRKRLTRRGVTLSAGLLAAVAEPARSAELPTGLVETSIRSVLAGAESATVKALVRSVSRPLVPIRTVLTVCLAVAVVGFGASSGSGPPPVEAPKKELSGQPVVKQAPLAAEAGVVRVAETPPPPIAVVEPPPDSFTYRGHAVTLDGKPVKDAQVFLHVNSLRPKPFVPRARTDADGRFAFSVKRSEIDGSAYEMSATPWTNGNLIGSASDLGVAWTRDLTPGQEAELLFIADDVPIKGRVLNLEGKPVAGAKVRTLWVFHPVGGDLTRWLEGLRGLTPESGLWKALDGLEGLDLSCYHPSFSLRRHGYDPAVPSATTSSDGRFTVRGIGRDRVALIQIEGNGIENRPVVVTTRLREAVTVPAFTLFGVTGTRQAMGRRHVDRIEGAKLDLIVGPDRVVSGKVTDVDTERPVTGAVVRSDHDAYGRMDHDLAWTITDSKGQYMLSGLPMTNETTLRIERPDGQPYLSAKVVVSPPPGLGSIDLNPQLKRGVWLTGKVFDRDSMAPLRARFDYGAEPDNPHLPQANRLAQEFLQYNRANDGSFRAAVLPGRGYLIVTLESAIDKLYERGQGSASDRMDDIIRAEPITFSGRDYHSLTRLEVAVGATEVEMEFPITPGRTAKVAVRGPNGEPLHGIVLPAELSGPRSEKLGPDGTLMVRPRQFVQAVCPDRKLAGRLRLTGNEKEPVTLTLQPWVVATGRIVAADGKPVPNAILSFASDNPGGDEPRGFWYKGESIRTDKNGAFRIEGLVPGASYQLLIWAKARPGQSMSFRADWKAGEVKDFGDLKPEQ